MFSAAVCIVERWMLPPCSAGWEADSAGVEGESPWFQADGAACSRCGSRHWVGWFRVGHAEEAQR